MLDDRGREKYNVTSKFARAEYTTNSRLHFPFWAEMTMCVSHERSGLSYRVTETAKTGT